VKSCWDGGKKIFNDPILKFLHILLPFTEWISLNINCDELPRETKLTLTVYVMKKSFERELEAFVTTDVDNEKVRQVIFANLSFSLISCLVAFF
jgi:hypothetical protein